MKVVVYSNLTRTGTVSGWTLAASEGLKRHGIEHEIVSTHNPTRCDLAVCWGFKKKYVKQLANRVLVMERGYLGDRMKWTSMGFDGLNNRAKFYNEGKDSTRLDTHFPGILKPWRDTSQGRYVLILGQVARDAAVRNVKILEWYDYVAERLGRRGIEARFRRHPLEGNTWRVRGASTLQGTLEDNLKDAKWVVSWNSNASVLSVLEGIPTVTMDEGAMAWDVTERDPSVEPPTPPREQWAAEMAWAQWGVEEIERGDAWDHLRQGVEDMQG